MAIQGCIPPTYMTVIQLPSKHSNLDQWLMGEQLYTTFDQTLNSVNSQLLVENLPHIIFHFWWNLYFVYSQLLVELQQFHL